MVSLSWNRLQTSPGKEVYERPLGYLEQIFYWDSNFDRTADTLQQAELEINPSRLNAKHVLSHDNISRIWSRLKQQFPLLGARVEERDEKSIFFVVEADNLHLSRPGEIIFQDVKSAEEARAVMSDMIVKERHLSNDLLAHLRILRRTDSQNAFHFLIHVSHIITDGMANTTIMKTFMDAISHDNGSSKYWDLPRQLALSQSTDALYSYHKLSVPKQRWRMAVAKIISAKNPWPAKGGHSIPRKVSQRTPYTPAHSKALVISFSKEESQAIISTCRQQKLTFGNAYPIIGQIATARVLLKRYLRGEISEEEWAFRKREPMTSAGPLNLRPFQDKSWLDAGGGQHVCVSIGFFIYFLPIMPLGSAANIRPGAQLPSYGDMLSHKRFWLRSRSIRKQAENHMKHPLFLEMTSIAMPARVERARAAALQWRKDKGAPASFSDRKLSAEEQASGLVFTNGGSSMGNVDLLLPRAYPLQKKTESDPYTVTLKTNSTMLHCRPTELYLGASTSAQQLRLVAYWDNNVFDEALVAEWLDEVRGAVEFYLGQNGSVSARL